jgi:hypothetical protein
VAIPGNPDRPTFAPNYNLDKLRAGFPPPSGKEFPCSPLWRGPAARSSATPPRDVWPAFCGVAILALHVVTFLAHSHWPFALQGVAFLALVYSYWWNLQCISHNFIHNPFFTSRWLNRLTASC